VKNLFCLLIALEFLASGTNAQQPQTEVPAIVRKSFQAKFPGIIKAEWKLKSDKNYEAEFTLNGAEVAAKFDCKGKWLETETTIEETDLTQGVRAIIAKQYKTYKITETQKVERADAKPTLFEVHLENAKEILKIQFERNGSVFSKTATRKK
jgi:hypothetical protein